MCANMNTPRTELLSLMIALTLNDLARTRSDSELRATILIHTSDHCGPAFDTDKYRSIYLFHNFCNASIYDLNHRVINI